MGNACTRRNRIDPELDESKTNDDNEFTRKPESSPMTASLDENKHSDEKIPLTDDRISETLDEGEVTSISEASDSRSASSESTCSTKFASLNPELDESKIHDNNDLTKPKSSRMTASLDEDKYSEEINTLTDDRISETLDESEVTSIGEASDSHSASSKSACSTKLASLNVDKLLKALVVGDLSFIHEIVGWAVATYKTDQWKHVSERLAFGFMISCNNSDGALLDSLIHLPHFHLFTSKILRKLASLQLKDDRVFLAKLRDALLPHVRPEHENDLFIWLSRGIEFQRPKSVLEFYDALWSKAIAGFQCFNLVESVLYLYMDLIGTKSRKSVVESVILVCISRHIEVLFDYINETSTKDVLSTSLKSKVFEYAITSNFAINKIPVLKHIDSDHEALVKAWIEEHQFFETVISTHESQLFQTHSIYIEKSIMPRILERMRICESSCKADEKVEMIDWLLEGLCQAMMDEDEGATWEPLLSGSASECTKVFYIDEFDYLLLTNSELNFHIGETLRSAVSRLKSALISRMYHPYLAFESLRLNRLGTYPCLNITWVDEQLRNTDISIDLVVVTPLKRHITLPHHNFLPVPREQQPCNADAEQCGSTQRSDTELLDQDNFIPSIRTEQYPRLFSEPNSNKYSGRTVFSQVENRLIKALPTHIIEGYRLAKAVRITHFILPIVQKLIELGVTVDIQYIIRTYHLKTCLFFLTQHYVRDDSDMKETNKWKWPIAIFEKLREFVMLGDVKEFFATERYVFRGEKIECIHVEEEFTASLPRFHCCRRRKARLLIIDQILSVMRLLHARINEADESVV